MAIRVHDRSVPRVRIGEAAFRHDPPGWLARGKEAWIEVVHPNGDTIFSFGKSPVRIDVDEPEELPVDAEPGAPSDWFD